MNKKIRKDTFICCIMIFAISFLIKMFQFRILPSKYFSDSKTILSLMNGNYYISDGSYNFTAKVFDAINVFKIFSLQEWSYLLATVFTSIIFLIIIKKKKYNLRQYIFIYSSMVLLNIYVFNLSKDIIQFVFFLLIYFILIQNWNNIKKLFFISTILIIEALNFRVYYAIMAIVMITLYCIYFFAINKENKNNRNDIFKILTLILILFFAEVFAIQLISSDNYISILYARSNVNMHREMSLDAVTIINDLLGNNTNYIKFIGNYLINIFRLMIPVELLFKGLKYLPFIVYQLFVTYQIMKSGTKVNDKNILWIITIISFMMVSIIFEPDFGSFIRHESSLILILLQLTNINYEIE